MKATKHYFPVVLLIMLYKVVKFESDNEIPKCYRQIRKGYRAVFSCGTVKYVKYRVIFNFGSVNEILIGVLSNESNRAVSCCCCFCCCCCSAI